MYLRRTRAFVFCAALLSVGPALLSGCGSTGVDFVAKKEPWRAKEENACIASGAVHQTQFIHARSALGGPSFCGAERPYELSAVMNGRVRLSPPALLRCPMVPQVQRWIADVVDPAARYYYGQPLSEIKVAASYSCRPMNNVSGAKLSEHGYANALDVSRFVLADGKVISVKADWNGDARDKAFLRSVHDGACKEFTTVLGPNYNAAHKDHLHVDLARHGRDGMKRYCH